MLFAVLATATHPEHYPAGTRHALLAIAPAGSGDAATAAIVSCLAQNGWRGVDVRGVRTVSTDLADIADDLGRAAAAEALETNDVVIVVFPDPVKPN
jgi:sirohydrochlorin ferrochelatase